MTRETSVMDVERQREGQKDMMDGSADAAESTQLQETSPAQSPANAARDLREEVLGPMSREAMEVEERMRAAVAQVKTRSNELDLQYQGLVQEVEDHFAEIITAAQKRKGELLDALGHDLRRKLSAMSRQQDQLQADADSLREQREATIRAMEDAHVLKDPSHVASVANGLRSQLSKSASVTNTAAAAASPSSPLPSSSIEPVEDVDLYVALPSNAPIVEQIQTLGWAGALIVDPSRCTLEGIPESSVLAGDTLRMTLTAYDRRGNQRSVGGAPVTALWRRLANADGTPPPPVKPGVPTASVSVEDAGNGTYSVVMVTAEGGAELEVEVLVGDDQVPGSPFRVSVQYSTILNRVRWVETFRSFFPQRSFVLQYRASRDGWEAGEFHKRCDGKGPTVVVLKNSTGDSVFGGYTSVPWSSTTGFKPDASAFLFSIVNTAGIPSCVMKPKGNPGHEVRHDPNNGPIFGSGHDLFISSVARHTTSSYTNLGHAYQPPQLPPMQDERTFLAGTMCFALSELEVYRVV